MPITPNNTTVLLLAAGHGKRMLPLTESTPKPLLKVGRYSLIEYHLIRLAELDFKHVVINVAYLAHQIIEALGDGSKYGLSIDFSDESSTGALETAGGIKKALKYIKSDPFITVNADIWTDFDFTKLLSARPEHATLAMVKNPSHNLSGDFVLDTDGILKNISNNENSINTHVPSMTYSGIALYRRHFFDNISETKSALGPLFRKRIVQQRLNGIAIDGQWFDIGTPERLDDIRQLVNKPDEKID